MQFHSIKYLIGIAFCVLNIQLRRYSFSLSFTRSVVKVTQLYSPPPPILENLRYHELYLHTKQLKHNRIEKSFRNVNKTQSYLLKLAKLL